MFSRNQLDEEKKKAYYEKLYKYYNLKKKYDDHKRSMINKIINTEQDIYLKKQLYSKLQFKCVNCGKVGGTIFNESNQKLRAVCGNSTDPCDLNISIEKKQVDLVPKLVETSLTNINNKKREMIKMKLDFLFNYISEEEAVSNFDNIKEELNNLQESYLDLYKILKDKTDNLEINKLIDEKILENEKLKLEYREIIDLYKSTKEKIYIKEAVDLYQSKIRVLDKAILDLNYNIKFVDVNEDGKKLVEKRYDIDDIELFVN
tara:strand:- start:228 stop:1007 length:780 start_codon:yes stop_codon:yes gene_type:complete